MTYSSALISYLCAFGDDFLRQMPVSQRGCRRHRTRRLQLLNTILVVRSVGRRCRYDGLSRRCLPSKRLHFCGLQKNAAPGVLCVCFFSGQQEQQLQREARRTIPTGWWLRSALLISLRCWSTAAYQETVGKCLMLLVQ